LVVRRKEVESGVDLIWDHKTEDVRTGLSTKADRTSVNELTKQVQQQATVLSTKAAAGTAQGLFRICLIGSGAEDVRTALSTKADQTMVNELTSLQQQQATAFATKASAGACLCVYALSLTAGRGADDELAKEIALRATIKDVCTLLDMKANIADVNTALMEVNKELDQRAMVCMSRRPVVCAHRGPGGGHQQGGGGPGHDQRVAGGRAVCGAMGARGGRVHLPRSC
jgi:hypothetical protein